MNKNTYQTVKLDKGEMNVYDFGSVKLHAYKIILTTKSLFWKRTARP